MDIWIILPVTAMAADLDLTNTSTSGCGTEWYGGVCLPNDVWGSTSVFGIATPTGYSTPRLTVGASPGTPSGIMVGTGSFGAYDGISLYVSGSASTKVGFLVRTFDSNGAAVSTDMVWLHESANTEFSAHGLEARPSGAVSWSARLVVSGDAAVISVAEAEAADDSGQCVECDKNCSNYTALGQSCPPNWVCTAECSGDSTGSNTFQAGVVLNP